MANGYNHPGRADFIRRAAESLGVVDAEDNHQPVAKASDARQIRFVENFISQSCDPSLGEDKAKILAHCKSAVLSLNVAMLAAVAMIRSAYEGHGLPVPDWLPPDPLANSEDAVAGGPVVSASADAKPKRTRGPNKPKGGKARESETRPEPVDETEEAADPDAEPKTEQAADEPGPESDGEQVQA